MSLEKTGEALYDPKSGIEKREHGKSVFDIEEKIKSDKEQERFKENKGGWSGGSNIIEEEKRGRKKIMLIGGAVLGAILLIVLTAVVVIKIRQNAFSQSRVVLTIEGNMEAKSSENAFYVIKYENNNRTALKDVEIVLNHSENFYPDEKKGGLSKSSDRSSKITIGEIKGKGKGEIEIEGKFYAAENYTIYLRPVMSYKPGGSSSEYKLESQIGVKIMTSPLEIEIIAPKEALDESTVEYEIRCRNKGDISFDNLNLRLEYSDGFIFQGATPSPVEGNNIWYLGEISSGTEKNIKMKGKIEGDNFDVKSIKATIYRNESGSGESVFGKAESITKVVVPPLAIIHKINGQSFLNVNAGENLKYKIDYANVGDTGLRDVRIKASIDSPIIDYSKLSLRSGAYESRTKTITWKANDIPQLKILEPGSRGSIEFDLPVKEKINVENEADKNFVIESVVTIDSSDVAFHSLGAAKNISNRVVAKLNSKVILDQLAFYNDLNIENFGPIPPEVGKETSYVIHWKITNVSNDISNVEVKGYLPTWTRWKGKIFPENENISFNERTNEIFWNAGKLKSATGILYDSKEVSFQVSVVPEINQAKREIILVSKAMLNAKDDFTGESISKEIGEKSSRITEDKELDDGGYMVKE
ncbi:MAG: hypothetical protein PHX98_01825 [Candidatus Moranbacteria bacterium]|nr:hypothetical protein [Candidatus Moranbacteria bacterium]